jgi:Protein of unknown function (DUF1116)
MTLALTGSGTMALGDADRSALQRMHGVDPVWRGMALARDVISFGRRTILHAGPPIGRGRLSRPLRNSAVAAVLFEGWADDEAEAERMIDDGEIGFVPAQDRSAMVPLAAVLSPNMAVQVVCDRNDPDNAAYSPINGGSPFSARFGLAGERVLSHLRWINGNLAATLAIIADHDVPLLAISDAAIAGGDDCHGKTTKASAFMVEALGPRLGFDTPERRFLDASPGFFLTLWMAAAKCIARAGEGDGSSIVTALGGNGSDFGLQIGGQPGRWFTAAAAPPEGRLDEGFTASDRLGAIGDSALVDALGFGAMLSCPENESEALLPCAHPAFRSRPISVGLSARRIVESGIMPRIALGILDRTGWHGRIGGGVYRAPVEPFANAVAARPQLTFTQGTNR